MPKNLTLADYNDASGESLNVFLNKLFDFWPGPFAQNPGFLFRGGLVDLIKLEETEGQPVTPTCWLIADATRTLLLDVLEGYWNGTLRRNDANARYRYIKSDDDFICLVRDYIAQNGMQMRVPSFTCKAKKSNAPSTYELTGDQVYSFKKDTGEWDSAVVRRFLELLLAGAHFVVVHSYDDLYNQVRPPSFFREFEKLPGAGTAGHSHYADYIALRGKNYPNLKLIAAEGDTLDSIQDDQDAVLLPVVLCDTTEAPTKYYNSFFQMEGWRPGKSMFSPNPWGKFEYYNKVLLAGYRHGADFATHQQTLWNISTYGASLFSEKRGAPVFLATPAWMEKKSHIYTGFKGPKAGHKWFKPELVEGINESYKPRQNLHEDSEKSDI